MEEQRKNSYDPNEDIVDRMWKRSKNSINLVIVVCNILVFLVQEQGDVLKESIVGGYGIQTVDGLRVFAIQRLCHLGHLMCG